MKDQWDRYMELSNNNCADIQIYFDDGTRGGLDFEADNGIFKWLLYYNGTEIEFSDIDKAWNYPVFNGLSLEDLKEKGKFLR